MKRRKGMCGRSAAALHEVLPQTGFELCPKFHRCLVSECLLSE